MPINPASLRDKWARGFSEAEAKATVATPQAPIEGFPIRYAWHLGPWYDIFTLQILKLQRDIRRAKAQDKLAIYLSCPISSRGGGYDGTNVDIARHIERRLLERWGESFWILNPVQYQLESKAGTGLMNEHAEYLGLQNIDELLAISRPSGGDYMRMWTTVLVENGDLVGEDKIDPRLKNTGQNFDAFYFIGPRDVHSFFMTNEMTLTSGIQSYFARKFATDPDFRESYSEHKLDWKRLGPRSAINEVAYEYRDSWTRKRKDFLRFYALRASANFSLGCHDEWNIFCELNFRRREVTRDPALNVDGDVGQQISGFFDGSQIAPPSTETRLSRGYAR